MLGHVVIVGASVAGVHAAEALRDAQFNGQVTLIDSNKALPYDVPPRSKAFLLGDMSDEELLLRPASWYTEKHVEFLGGHAARNVDIAHKRVALDNGEWLSYDALLLCTGSEAIVPRVRGDTARIHVLRTFQDALGLRQRLGDGRRLLVIGAGFIGLEAAAAARRYRAHVTVIEADHAPLQRALGPIAGEWFRRLHERHGVEVRTDETVQSVDAEGAESRVALSSGATLVVDAVLAGVGAAPVTGWLSDSGIELSASGGVVCDAYLSTSATHVWAAGDICDWDNKLYEEHTRIEHWTTAVEHGQYAARSMLGMVNGPYVSAPYFWTDQFDAKVRSVGYIKGADISMVGHMDDRSLVVAYGKHGRLRAALCVNAPRALIACRQAIVSAPPWSDVPALLKKCT